MVKRSSIIFSLVIVTMLVLSGCQNQNSTNTHSVSPTVPPVNDKKGSASTDSTSKGEYAGLNGIIVHTANGYSDTLDNDYFNLFQPLLKNIESLLWIAPRGGAGIDGDKQMKKSADVQAIVESSKDKPNYKGEFIRLKYDSQIPKTGQNWLGHKDILVYQDTKNKKDAYLALQDPKAPDQWDLYKLPDYGQWLSKELAIILRVGLGF